MPRLLIVALALACVGCGKSNPTGPSADELRGRLKSPDAGARREAAAALGRLGPDARTAVADLAAALADPDDGVRVNAATALWSVGADARSAVPDLGRAVKDRNAEVRLCAAGALGEAGQDERGLDLLAHAGFAALGLQTFLTAGPKEARAWTIPNGATAPEAAGVIHTDFQRGFIKAEVVSYDDLVDAGSMTAARAAGKVRMEGKDYVMSDGDVVEFRFNV